MIMSSESFQLVSWYIVYILDVAYRADDRWSTLLSNTDIWYAKFWCRGLLQPSSSSLFITAVDAVDCHKSDWPI